jgi:hypothetical protein
MRTIFLTIARTDKSVMICAKNFTNNVKFCIFGKWK